VSDQPDRHVHGADVSTPDRVQQAHQLQAVNQQLRHEIAERTRTEQELIEHEKLQSVLAMAGAVCHELNQPLQVLCGFIDLLRDGASDAMRTEYLGIMAEQVQRMAEVTRKLGNIVRYKTKPYGPSHQIVDLEQSAAG